MVGQEVSIGESSTAPTNLPGAPRQPRPTAAQVAGWTVLLFAVVWLSLRGWGSFQVGAYQDDAQYMLAARSLAFGDQYGLINWPGAPHEPKYPFAFPLLLAPLVWLFPHDPQAATTVALAATLINISLLFWGWPLLSPSTSRWWGLGVAWLYGVSPMTVGQTRVVMSEPVFTTFALAALLLVEACVRAPRRGRLLSIPLGVALTFALFTRSIGIAVWAAVLLRLAMAVRRVGYAPLAGILCGSLGSLLLVLGLTSIEPRHLLPQKYITEARTAGPSPTTATESPVERVLRVGGAYALTELREVVVSVGGGQREQALADRIGMHLLPEVLGAVVTALIAVGAWRALRMRALAASALLFELVYLGTLLLWPWVILRYLYPLQPLLAFELLLGLAAVDDAARGMWAAPGARRSRGRAVVVVWAGLVALSVWKSAMVADARSFTRDLRVGATWLRDHSATDAIVMARYAAPVYLYAERRTVPLMAGSASELEAALDEQRVDYLLIGPKLAWNADGSLPDDELQVVLLPGVAEMAARGRLTEVYESPPHDKVHIYRVER